MDKPIPDDENKAEYYGIDQPFPRGWTCGHCGCYVGGEDGPYCPRCGAYVAYEIP